MALRVKPPRAIQSMARTTGLSDLIANPYSAVRAHTGVAMQAHAGVAMQAHAGFAMQAHASQRRPITRHLPLNLQA
jgi:hypothetical protein